MKNRFFLALIVPVAAFIVSCGPVDIKDDATLSSSDITSDILDQNVDARDKLNLSEENKNDYWLALYIPSAFHYYAPPFFWGPYYPNAWTLFWNVYPYYGWF